MYESIDPDDFQKLAVYLNRVAGEQGLVDSVKLKSAIVSSSYYPSFELKLASIIRSMIKNHAFVDGNKRTATMFFRLILAFSKRRLNLNDQDIIELIRDIAANNYSVEEIQQKLFKQVSEESLRHWIDVVKKSQ